MRAVRRPYDEAMRAQGNRTLWVSAIGVLLVTAYAVLAALQITIWTPLAAAPGLSLAEIRAEMSAAGENPGEAAVATFLGAGIAIAVIAAIVLARGRAHPALAVLVFAVILAMGAPAFFVASFGPGMALADTFFVSAGVTLPGVAAYYLASALMLPVMAGTAFVWVVGPRRPAVAG